MLTFGYWVKTIPADCRFAAILPVTKNKSIVPSRTMHTGRMSGHSTNNNHAWFPRLFPANSASACLRFAKFRPQFSESCGATYRRICEMFNASQSMSGPLTQTEKSFEIDDQIWSKLATLSFLKLVRNWPKNAVLNLALCCGAIWRHKEKAQYRCTTTIHSTYNCSKKDFCKFTSCMIFGADKLVHFEPFLDYRYEIWHLLSAIGKRHAENFLYRCTSTISALKYRSGIFFSNPSAIYTKWCAKSFPPIFWLFAIFDRKFAKIVAPSDDKYKNYIVPLKDQSLVEKRLKTSSKSAYKRQRNACSNYAPLERTALRTQSVTNKKKTNTTFSHLRPARVVRSSPNFAWW